MPICAMVGCSQSYGRGKGVRLFRLPTVIKHHCKKAGELSSKRRAAWLSRINRNLTGRLVNGMTIFVCQRHFVSGKPSQLFDETHPDWAPTLHLGHSGWKKENGASVNRYLRRQARRCKNVKVPPYIGNQQKENVPDYDAAEGTSSQHVIIQGSDLTEADESVLAAVYHGSSHLEFAVTERTSSVKPVDHQEDMDAPFAEEATIISETSQVTGNVQHFENFGTEYPISEQAATEPNLCEPLGQGEVSPSLHVIGEAKGMEKKNIGCQADYLPIELLALKDSMAQKTFVENQELAELRAKFAHQLQENALLREQLHSKTDEVQSLKTCREELQIQHGMLSKDNECLRKENGKLRLDVKNMCVSEDSLRDDNDKTKFYTGIPSFELLKIIYDFVEAEVPHSHRNVLPKFTEFLVTLLRLRLGLLEKALAYRFNIARSSVSKICSRWMQVMSIRLEKLIAWPERSVLRKTIPSDFKQVFGDRFTVIIDCFEVFINKPSSLLPRAETFSRYKHHNTVKFLIGITPQGTVCFVSEAWGGRASDKHITLNSGFLDKLVPGDVVLADRGFDIDEEVGMRQAKIAIPAFTKGKTQLSFDDIRKTREIANIRIHVERVIGFLRRKFRILGSLIPYSYLTAPPDDDSPPIDHIIKIRCALANMCPSIIRGCDPNTVPEDAGLSVLQLVFRDDMEEPMFYYNDE